MLLVKGTPNERIEAANAVTRVDHSGYCGFDFPPGRVVVSAVDGNYIVQVGDGDTLLNLSSGKVEALDKGAVRWLKYYRMPTHEHLKRLEDPEHEDHAEAMAQTAKVVL